MHRVETIKNRLNSPGFNPNDQKVVCPARNELHSFTPTSVNELSTLLGNTCVKSCILDPIPGNIMKACINTLLHTIIRIVNLSFTEACVPEILKQSAVEPRIKKPILDNELLSSSRPVSNLRFISAKPPARSQPHLRVLDVCINEYHLFCLDFMALESRPVWSQPVDSELHSKGKSKYCIL